ncbi:MAG: hemerythrin domain-containing protein [Acidimicrobiales bacterium]
MTSASPIDVRDMAIVHQAFRRAYQEAAALVRGAAASAAERVRFLASHIDLTIALLHLHHEGEDELLYPKLIERAPERTASTEQIKHEHEDIQAQMAALSDACKAWQADPSDATGEELAAALDRLNDTLQIHLDNEEKEIVPLAAVTLTQKEWDEMGAHAVAKMAPKQRAIAFGMLLEPLDEADRAHMKKHLPPPIRFLFPVLIQRPWTKYANTLRRGA